MRKPDVPPSSGSVCAPEPDVWWSSDRVNGIDALIWADPLPYRCGAPEAAIEACELVRSDGVA